MPYFVFCDGEYIQSYGSALSVIPQTVSDEFYSEVEKAAIAKPAPPSGYGYRLRTDLTWELVELPPEPEPDATSEDYEAALNKLGVET